MKNRSHYSRWLVTFCYLLLPTFTLVTYHYLWLPTITCCYPPSPLITHCYLLLPFRLMVGTLRITWLHQLCTCVCTSGNKRLCIGQTETHNKIIAIACLVIYTLIKLNIGGVRAWDWPSLLLNRSHNKSISNPSAILPRGTASPKCGYPTAIPLPWQSRMLWSFAIIT